MDTKSFTEVSIGGKHILLPAIDVDSYTIMIQGRFLRIGEIKGEGWLTGDVVGNPEQIIETLKKSRIGIDIYRFTQKLPSTQPKYRYHIEWTNVAAIPIVSFLDWWENRLPQVTRKNVRRASRRGVVINRIEYSDALIRDLVKINDSTPVRQRRHYRHFGKSFDAVKKDCSSYLDRSEYLGAYFENELIGFIRLIHMGEITSIIQLLCMPQHSDRRPANALIAKAVEICAERGIRFLTYGQYVYGVNFSAPLTEFKRRNGFEQFNLPSYYVPLTTKGRIAVAINVHMGLKNVLPKRVMRTAIEIRDLISKKFKAESPQDKDE